MEAPRHAPAPTQTGILVADSIYERFMGKPVKVFLTNGVKLVGVISAVDEGCFILSAESDQLVMNHAVATILS